MGRGSVDNITCDTSVRSDIATATTILASAFGDLLTAIILTGSAARGCFHPHTSDIDLLVVLEEDALVAEPPLLVAEDAVATDPPVLAANGLSKLSTPFDVTVMTAAQLTTDTWPTPVVCLIKPPGRVVTKPRGSKDALLHRQDAFEAGKVVLENRPVELTAVPFPLVHRCVEYTLPFIRHRFKNPALMFCRVLYWFDHGSLCSKIEAATAASELLPPRFHPLVSADLAVYHGEQAGRMDSQLLDDLERYTKEVARTAKSGQG